MKLSVCLITYNHERYIRQALDGVLMQEVGFPWEVVVGEDCSTDRTGEIVRGYAARRPDLIRVLDTPHNLGQFGKPNLVRTLAACTGEYVALLEGDDYWTSPDKLARQVSYLDTTPECSACGHPVAVVDANSRTTGKYPPAVFPRYDVARLLEGNPIPTCSVVFRRGLVREFPEWFFHTVASDWPLHLLHALHSPVGMLPEAFGAYREHGEGVWSQRAYSERLQDAIRILTGIATHLTPELRSVAGRSIAVHQFWRCWALTRAGADGVIRPELQQLHRVECLLPFPHRLAASALRSLVHWPEVFRMFDAVVSRLTSSRADGRA